jgi:RNA polymerase sigma-70 factor (ECF subfamily)
MPAVTLESTLSHDAPSEAAVSLILADVYRAQFAFVWRSCRRLGVRDEALDDVTQDVFLVVHQKLSTFEGRARIETWIYKILRYVVLRHLEKGGRRRAREIPLEVDVASAAPGPHEQLRQDEATLLLHGLLGELSHERREVLVLSELEQMSAPEIAKATGTKLNTVYSRLRAARADFEQALGRQQAREKRRGE